MMFWLPLLALGVPALAESSSCERLKASLTYTQEQAPRDLSSVLPVVVEKVNRVLDGVVDVEVEWTGADLHGRVGEHIVECTVTRLASAVASETLEVFEDEDGRQVSSQCFHVPFTILDTNECTLPAKHPMRHKCPMPAICVNTIGSYECVCPRVSDDEWTANVIGGVTAEGEGFWNELASQDRSPWEVSFVSNAKTSCPSSSTTHGCCPFQSSLAEGSKCRERFKCPVDPCSSNQSDCASNAQCVRANSPSHIPSYTCECPEGLMGNGHSCKPEDPKPQPKVQHDGVTPTEQTIKNNFYCGCTKPVVDACSGFPPCQGKHEICTVASDNSPMCACKPGYVFHDEFGCVDQHPPTLKLRNDPHGDQTLRLKQGDFYKEFMVDIMDENAEDYLRSLKISYSQALPPGCLTQVGEFHVNYTVAMPWATPPYVRITRRVVVDDIDECQLDVSKYQHLCPSLVPQCDRAAGAKCINTIGSYACQCPAQSKGDGFVKSAKFDGFHPPESYQGGTSCIDTSKPIITLAGPNPKIFKTCECGGLNGIMSNSKSNSEDNRDLQSGQRSLYEQDIKEMIRATMGAELCASHDHRQPKPRECAKAVDHTYQGDVDLSDRVVIGEPQQKSDLHWIVPYNVKDDAGNEAATVYRDVIVQEVDLATFETKIREEMKKEQEIATRRAVDKAIREEKMKWDKEHAAADVAATNRQRRGQNSKTCPACPPCDCRDSPVANRETCEAYCENVSRSCTLNDDSYMYAILFWMEDFLSPSLIPGIILVVGLFLIFFVLKAMFTAIFNPRAYQGYDYDSYGRSNDSDILRSPEPQPMSVPSSSAAPPKVSLVLNNNGNNGSNPFFSPGSQGGMGSPSPRNFSQTPSSGSRDRNNNNFDESIYSTQPIITPSKTGDGVVRRSPYR